MEGWVLGAVLRLSSLSKRNALLGGVIRVPRAHSARVLDLHPLPWSKAEFIWRVESCSILIRQSFLRLTLGLAPGPEVDPSHHDQDGEGHDTSRTQNQEDAHHGLARVEVVLVQGESRHDYGPDPGTSVFLTRLATVHARNGLRHRRSPVGRLFSAVGETIFILGYF